MPLMSLLRASCAASAQQVPGAAANGQAKSLHDAAKLAAKKLSHSVDMRIDRLEELKALTEWGQVTPDMKAIKACRQTQAAAEVAGNQY